MIAARRLTKRYGATTAVDDLSFDVTPGMVTGFLGPNGAGKSTTMRMILGLDHPTSGAVTIAGRSYRDLPAPLQEVGALLEARADHPGRTAGAHLRWIARAGGVPRRRVDEVLAIAGLSDVAGRRLGGFSLGMRQRLGIATALLGDPGTLLFDEPVNGLDPEGILWMRTMMKDLAAEDRTVFVSSHLMSEMQQTADRVVVIGGGRFIADMTIDDLTRHAAGDHVTVVSPSADRLATVLVRGGAALEPDPDTDGGLLVTGMSAAQIGDLAAADGLALHELTPRRASLEAAFLELTHDSVAYRSDGTGTPAGEVTHAPATERSTT